MTPDGRGRGLACASEGSLHGAWPVSVLRAVVATLSAKSVKARGGDHIILLISKSTSSMKGICTRVSYRLRHPLDL